MDYGNISTIVENIKQFSKFIHKLTESLSLGIMSIENKQNKEYDKWITMNGWMEIKHTGNRDKKC